MLDSQTAGCEITCNLIEKKILNILKGYLFNLELFFILFSLSFTWKWLSFVCLLFFDVEKFRRVLAVWRTNRQGAHLQEERWKDGACVWAEGGDAEELNCWVTYSPIPPKDAFFTWEFPSQADITACFIRTMRMAAGWVNHVSCHSNHHRGNHWQYGGIIDQRRQHHLWGEINLFIHYMVYTLMKKWRYMNEKVKSKHWSTLACSKHVLLLWNLTRSPFLVAGKVVKFITHHHQTDMTLPNTVFGCMSTFCCSFFFPAFSLDHKWTWSHFFLKHLWVILPEQLMLLQQRVRMISTVENHCSLFFVHEVDFIWTAAAASLSGLHVCSSFSCNRSASLWCKHGIFLWFH